MGCSDRPPQLQSDHSPFLQDAQKDATHTSQALPISIHTISLTPSPLRPLPTTGRPTGRHPQHVMVHEESYVPPIPLEARREGETSGIYKNFRIPIPLIDSLIDSHW
ncbi:unnamed protein product, partial [Boreogadus saida]